MQPPARVSAAERHAKTVARAKGNPAVRLDPVSGRHTQAIGASDGGEHHARLHHGKAPADTDARTAAEGQVRETMTRLDPIGCEPLGIEAQRILPQPRIAVGEVGADRHHAAGTNGVPPDLVVRHRHATERVGRRKQPHRLLDDHAGIGQRFDVSERRLSFAQRAVHLVVQRAFDAGMSRQQVQRPRQGQRVVSCPAAKNVITSSRSCGRIPSPVSSSRAQGANQQIVRTFPGGASCGDDA